MYAAYGAPELPLGEKNLYLSGEEGEVQGIEKEPQNVIYSANWNLLLKKNIKPGTPLIPGGWIAEVI